MKNGSELGFAICERLQLLRAEALERAKMDGHAGNLERMNRDLERFQTLGDATVIVHEELYEHISSIKDQIEEREREQCHATIAAAKRRTRSANGAAARTAGG